MRDWQDFVESKLAGLRLPPREKAEVMEELAAHMEESCESFRAGGLAAPEAMRRTFAQVTDWRDLQREILIAKRRVHLMKKRVQQLWIPGFLTLILSTVFLMTLQKLGFQPRIVWSGPNAILLYVPWLLSLPFFGAAGAYVSLRAGGSRRIVLLASVFPVLALTTAFLLMFPIGMIVERVTGSQVDFSVVATALLMNGIGWLLVPGVALIAGGLPVQLYLSQRLGSQRIAGG